MAEFAYNNVKNTCTGYTSFELNFGFHLRVSYEKNLNSRIKSKNADKLAIKLHTLISVYKKNIQHVKEFQKHYYYKNIKLRSYFPDDKIWLKRKYIKIKQIYKLEFRFFRLF